MTLNNFFKCKRVEYSYFCDEGNVVRDVPDYSKKPSNNTPFNANYVSSPYSEKSISTQKNTVS
jgi:hypothetical protein